MAGCTAYAETNPLATRHTELAKKANPSLVDKVLLEVLPASRPHSRAVSRLQLSSPLGYCPSECRSGFHSPLAPLR